MAATMRLLTALAAVLVGLVAMEANAAECTAKFKLNARYLNTTTRAGNNATCSDGTQPGYFIDLPDAALYSPPYNWIIYLGDGETCIEEECDKLCDLDNTKVGGVCEGVANDLNDVVDSGVDGVPDKVIQCYFARVQCSSRFLDGIRSITPQSILCREIDYFASYARVFIPVCTLDWWLGRGSVKNITSTRFRGAFVLDKLIETLDDEYNMKASQLVVLAGTRGGGVGALHSAKFVREKLNGPQVITIADSAWFIDTEAFSPPTQNPKDIFVIDSKLKRDTQEWIDFARVNSDCDAVWNVGGPGVASRHRCMIVPELLPFLQSEKIMFTHSQYDLFFLSTMGLLDSGAAKRFFDAQSYALGAISYVEAFGTNVRSATLDSAALSANNHYFYMPACGTHSFIIPTSLHLVRTQTRNVGGAGQIELTRDIITFENTSIGDLTVKDAIGRWISTKGNAAVIPTSGQLGDGLNLGIVTDLCKGFLCNPSCSESIIPFALKPVFGLCGRNVVLAYALLMMIVLWLTFAWGYLRVRIFRSRARQYWTAFKTGRPLPDFGYSKQRELMLIANSTGMNQEELNYLTPAQQSPKANNANTFQPVVPGGTMSSSPLYGGPPGLANAAPSHPLSPIIGSPASASTSSMSPPSPMMSSPASSSALTPHVADTSDDFDLVALAEALTSKDKATRLAAKKAYKEHQKRAAQRRKDAKKTAEERAYAEKEREAKRIFEERQAALGLQAQQAKQAEEEAKKQGKKPEESVVARMELETLKRVSSPEPVPAPKINTGKIQQKAQEELLTEAAANDYRKVHLMVRDLSYWAPPRKSGNAIRRMFTRQQSGRYQILKNVDLAVKPAQVHALMGPSGSGKSTLLDVLALIRDSGEMQGAHYINGVRSDRPQAAFLKDWLRHNISYVRQTDVLFPLMTVREHLQHAAWLLLPQFMSDAKKLRRVQQVIELLELDACSDTICGDGGIKIEGGISGGQRRRVSVATQLVRLPACLLLDEPTTGLDSTNALLLVKSLHTLAHRGGLTVVMTIHQPRNEIFALFDQLTILVAGKIVFSGPPTEAARHFSINMTERQDLSVANSILDKLAEAPEHEVRGYETSYIQGPLGRKVAEEMKAEATDFDEQMAVDLQEVLREQALGEGRWSWESPSSASMQMWVLMSRTMRRGGFDLRKTVFLAFLGGCIVGLCFLGIGTVTARTALCYLCVSTMTFLQGAFLGDRYLAEKQMYDHESSAGSAVQWTAFLASQFVRDAVTSTLEAIAFGIPAYWIGGMFKDGSRFILFLIMIVLIAHVCISSNVAVEIDRDNLRAAALVNVAYVGLGALFNGFIIQISDLPIYLSWLPYIMITYWGFAGILVNDFAGEKFGCQSSVLECATRTGDVVVVAFKFEQVDAYVTMLACIIMTFLFRTCAVTDFFLRYVRGRGSGLKLIGGGSTLEDDHDKAQPRKAVFANQASRLGGAMKSMISNRGDAGRRMVEEAKRKNAEDTQRVVAAGGGAGLAYNEEWDQVAEEGGKAKTFRVAAKEPLYKKITLSRMIYIIIMLIDISFLGVVCTISVGNFGLFYMFLGISSLFTVYAFIQFVVSVCSLIPITPSGPKDCTWAVLPDAAAFFLTIGDVVIMIQMWSGNAFAPVSDRNAQDNNAATFFVLAGLTRIFRLARVALFWVKVTRYHEIRATSWLLFADQEKEKKMEMLAQRMKNGGQGFMPGPGAPPPVPPPPSAGFGRKSRTQSAGGRANQSVKSVRLAANPMWSAYAATPDFNVNSAKEAPKIDPNSF